MKPTICNLDHGTGVLSYQKFGSGGPVVFCFHGFGQHAEVYRPLVELLGNSFTTISVDLYHFGLSHRNVASPLTTTEWANIFEKLCAQEAVTTFHVVGYSLGGKFAIASMMAAPARCMSLHLLAPDGIRHSFWYELATTPLVAKMLFRPLANHPTAIIKVIAMLEWIGAINPKVARFGRNMTETPQQRKQLYNVWMMCKPLRHKRSDIIHTLNQYGIPTTTYVGKHDLIIKQHIFDDFLAKVERSQKIVMDCGHNHLIQKSSAAIHEQLAG